MLAIPCLTCSDGVKLAPSFHQTWWLLPLAKMLATVHAHSWFPSAKFCSILFTFLFFVPSFLSHSHSLLHPTMPNPQNPGLIISRLLPHGTGPRMSIGCQQFARLLWVWLCLGLLPFWVAWNGLITCHLAHGGARRCISLSSSLSSYQDRRLDFEIHFGTFNFSGFWLDSLDYTCRRFVKCFGYLRDLLILKGFYFRNLQLGKCSVVGFCIERFSQRDKPKKP